MLSFFSGISIPGGFLVAAYFFYIRKEHRLKVNLLSALFVALSLRCSKSFLCFSLGMPNFGMALGFLGLASIGPLLWIYVNYANNVGVSRIKTKDYFHFIVTIIGFFAITVFGREFAAELYLYTTYLLLFYVAMAWRRFLQFQKKSNKDLRTWNQMLLTSITVFCGIFLAQYHTDYIVNYTIGAAFASATFYILLYFALKTPVLFPKKQKNRKSDPQVIKKVQRAIDVEKIYRQPSLTLDQFAKELGHPSYLVSRTIKTEFEKSFSELINHLRIQEAIQELSQNSQEYQKIEGLAYAVGFNTPSTFYAAFKKVTGMNPTEYQHQMIENEKGID